MQKGSETGSSLDHNVAHLRWSDPTHLWRIGAHSNLPQGHLSLRPEAVVDLLPRQRGAHVPRVAAGRDGADACRTGARGRAHQQWLTTVGCFDRCGGQKVERCWGWYLGWRRGCIAAAPPPAWPPGLEAAQCAAGESRSAALPAADPAHCCASGWLPAEERRQWRWRRTAGPSRRTAGIKVGLPGSRWRQLGSTVCGETFFHFNLRVSIWCPTDRPPAASGQPTGRS